MIKFFRKIRQNLLSQNKTGKYFKYAIGEIVLVVIGILIALQINNWNENRKERKTEQTNLVALQEEFTQNKNLLQEVIQLNNQIIAGTEKMIETFNSKTLDTISEYSIVINTYRTVGNEINFTPKTGVLSEMMSSGELKLIQNDILKHKLAGFESWINQVEQQEKEVYEYRRLLINQIINTGNLKMAYTILGARNDDYKTAFDSVSNKSQFNQLSFMNKLIVFQSSSNSTTKKMYEPLETEIEKILELIDLTLKK